MAHRLDGIDKRILYHLADDARNLSAPAVADEVDVSAATIRNRIRQLEDHGVVRGYHADIDYERVDGMMVNLFICTVAVADREEIAGDALEIPGVVNVRELMSGRGNLHVVAVGEDTNDVTRIARDLSNLGVEIEDEALVQREYVRPYQPFGPAEDRGRSSTADFRRLAGGAEVLELTAVEGAPVVGTSIAEAADAGVLGDDVLVVGIERGDRMVTPRGDTTIQAGDLVTIFSREGVPADALRAFTEPET